MRCGRILALAVCCFGLWQVPASEAGTISSLVAFGDSTTDTGNVFIGSGFTIPPAPYFNGRFSNGPVWIEQFASARGLPIPTPSLAGGGNYAFGGARTGSGLALGVIPNVQTQIGLYLTDSLGVADPTALYVIAAGGNDYLGDGQTNPEIPTNNIIQSIVALASVGATQFMVPNLLPLGQVPDSIDNLTPLERAGLNALTVTHNQLLDQKLDLLETLYPTITVYRPRIYQLFGDIQANPLAYGFTNITDGSLGDFNLTGNGYFFWDGLHSTTQGDSLIAARAIASLPEPSSIVLLLVAAVGCAAQARGRRTA